MVSDAAPPRVPSYERSPRAAVAEMPADVRDAWRARYSVQADAELRAEALLNRAEATLQAAGKPATIRTVWILLADRAGADGDADVRIAAALAGMAMGLRPS